MTKSLVIYQAKDGAIEFSLDASNETIWATQRQMAELFGVDVRTVNEHLLNIFRTDELSEKAVIRKFRITASDNKQYLVNHYNLDTIISVGYRVNSKQATKFRQWSTRTLRDYITQGYALNPSRIQYNMDHFLQAVSSVKELSEGNTETLDLVSAFASTWFSLDAYDKDELPKNGASKQQVDLTALELNQELAKLRLDLIAKKQATELFGQEKNQGSLDGILGNVFQSFDGNDVYASVEEKAAHLLYFVIKDHPFNDGNKRSGAFAFVWYLQKAGALHMSSLTP